MLIKRAADIRSSEITDKKVYYNRRQFIRAAAAGTAAVATAATAGSGVLSAATPAAHGRKLDGIKKSPFSANPTVDKTNTWDAITTYNNYYEFGIDKDLPSENARALNTANWTVNVTGECNKKGAYHVEDILKGETLEERVYRHRCVEAWSMVIPWVGIPLANFLKRCEPTGNAKFVEFTTITDSKTMLGLRQPYLHWPYVEGLRMDEAMHPLTLLVAGLYDEVLPNQNGAPLRIAVPWKYGFKHVKSIVKVNFTAKQPINSWQEQAPSEYGFYANVNPQVDHPRWSQATERRIGEFLRRKTLMFNGYGDQVASLYTGLDLRKNY
jgi:methionine sulfoxide reductase catalytic subunit